MANKHPKPIDQNATWTEAEINLLKELYPVQSNEEVAEQLKKTVRSIRSKAQKLELKKDGAKWSTAEKKLLLKLWETSSVQEIEAALKTKFKTTRTKWAIISKHRQLTGKGHPPSKADLPLIV